MTPHEEAIARAFKTARELVEAGGCMGYTFRVTLAGVAEPVEICPFEPTKRRPGDYAVLCDEFETLMIPSTSIACIEVIKQG